VLEPSDTIDNPTLCDMFGVANMGGIRINNRRTLIVLVSNNTDPTYRNEWRDGILHFVGMGSVGPQRLGHQNKTLADSTKRNYGVHLFEVRRKGQYTYAARSNWPTNPTCRSNSTRPPRTVSSGCSRCGRSRPAPNRRMRKNR
jgi:5-methylcytosine-specific restriction enzyme A